MSDTLIQQEPEEELKRLVAEIGKCFSVIPNGYQGWETDFDEDEAAKLIQAYIQSRIPEVSEDAYKFASQMRADIVEAIDVLEGPEAFARSIISEVVIRFSKEDVEVAARQIATRDSQLAEKVREKERSRQALSPFNNDPRLSAIACLSRSFLEEQKRFTEKGDNRPTYSASHRMLASAIDEYGKAVWEFGDADATKDQNASLYAEPQEVKG